MNLRKGELIGLRVQVVRSADPTHVNLFGRVVDETRNLLVLDIGGVDKRIPKKGTRFRFEVQGGIEIEGDEIRYRPEDRIKKAR